MDAPGAPDPSPSSPAPPATAGRLLIGVVTLTALFAAVAGVLQLGWHARLFAGRIGFPLDLEWMEGGMLVHAQRIAAGQPIYTAPSMDFIPFLYTPLYPALLAGLSKIVPLGYVMGRAVSLLAFAGALGLLVWVSLRQARGQGLGRGVAALLAVAAAGAVAAGFVFAGAFFDLARADSLLLLLEVTALVAAVQGASLGSAALAGLAIALAFFTKQTASVVGVAIGVPLLLANWRRGLVYGGVAAVVLAAGVAGLTRATDGWFWKYIFGLHQSHAFFWRRAFHDTPLLLGRHTGWVLGALIVATVGLALSRRLVRSDLVVWGAALGGLVAACVGFGTEWAHENAYIPAVYFPAFAAAVLGGRLAAHALQGGRWGAAVLAGLCAAGLGAQGLTIGRPDRQRLVPITADRAAAARFLDRLRALPGDGFIPFHPYYATLVGKRPFVHRQGIWDVQAMMGRPADLDLAIAQQRFPFVILDWKSQPGEWPGLDSRYHVVSPLREGIDSVRMFSGAQTSPIAILMPTREPAPLPAGGLRIADFEWPDWNGWTATGDAFGPAPASTPVGLYGHHAADSGRNGPGHQGTLRSPPFTVAHARLRFTVQGPRDPGLRVLLLDGPETVYEVSPTGATTDIEWNIGRLSGRQVVLVIEDRSVAGGIAVDEVVAY